MSEKIKIQLDGAAETMLQSFYARAQYSKSKKHKFYDAKAVELVDRIDYDFSLAEKDSTMPNRDREKKLYRMVPLIGLVYKTFGKYRKENLSYFEQSEKEIIEWITQSDEW